MRRNSSFSSPLFWFSVLLILAGVTLLVLQLLTFSRLRATYPNGMTIADVPVGGLDRQQAAQRLREVYTLPVELRYRQSVIQLNPTVVGFELDINSMLAAADLQRAQQPFWTDFWNYLWRRNPAPTPVPLRATFSEARLRNYLKNEIAARYDQPAIPAQPIIGTVNFQPGQPGTALDIDRSVALIETALRSTTNRSVDLSLQGTLPARPSFSNLETLLKQTIDIADFDGLAGVYLLDLQTAQEIHFLYTNGQSLPTQPDMAFTAASVMKLPIMISAFRRIENLNDSETAKLLTDMITKSGNEASDWLMDRVITEPGNPGPLLVTQDLRDMGIQNTFLAGYFYAGAPLLARYETPANSRTDYPINRDLYNQTTPSDVGMLLTDLYQCAESSGGNLIARFPSEITQTECRQMIELLVNNRLPVLLTRGLPEGTRIAHKHGWVTDFNGNINTIADGGIIYTPGGNYVLVVYLYNPVQLVWDPASLLVADLSKAVYNYYNLP